MSNRWPAGIIRRTPVTPTGPLQNGTASGVWTLAEASYWTKQGLWPTAGNFLAVEDVFSTWLYTGNGSTQTITNGLNLSGQGGMVWAKSRSAPGSNSLYDTVRGAGSAGNSKVIFSNSTVAQQTSGFDYVSSFNSNGFSIAFDASGGNINTNGTTYASWTFREAPNFFDIVTYTGNGVSTGRNISHNLGARPGFIIVKRTDSASDWAVLATDPITGFYHGGVTSTPFALNRTNAKTWSGGGSAATATTFNACHVQLDDTTNLSADFNVNGATYVAYLYAHDTASTGFIQCGSFTTDGSGNATVNLGWEPQWLMAKSASLGGPWVMTDIMRGMTASGADATLLANSSAAEGTSTIYAPTATGFTATNLNGSTTYTYMAIRRGPMRTPTLGTSVFSPNTSSASTNTQITTNFPVDMQFPTILGGASTEMYVSARLTGVPSTQTTSNFPYLNPRSAAAETSFNIVNNWNNTGFAVSSYYSGSSQLYWNFRRAPGFFDVVCYTGTGNPLTLNHNLGVAPELIIYKARSSGYSWIVQSSAMNVVNDFLILNATSAKGTTMTWRTPTSTTFGVNMSGNVSECNYAGTTYVAYLFASAPGVSKVGSYTGNGSSQTINCAFTTGARYVLIKRTDSTGDWLVWDSARGIVAGNDPYLAVNSSAAQVTTNDSVDTDNTGFIVNQVAASNVNVNGATYIFLAIA